MVIFRDTDVCVEKPETVATLLQEWLKGTDEFERDKEHFIVLFLDVRNKIKLGELVAVGSLDAVLVHPREVYRRAIVTAAGRLICAHNHPSGVCEPSREDREMTERLSKAGEVVGITLLDHVIFSGGDYYSFVEHGLL